MLEGWQAWLLAQGQISGSGVVLVTLIMHEYIVAPASLQKASTPLLPPASCSAGPGMDPQAGRPPLLGYISRHALKNPPNSVRKGRPSTYIQNYMSLVRD